MDSHATDQFGNYKAFSINGDTYTPGDIVVALIAARALADAVNEAQAQRTRADDAERRVRELEAEVVPLRVLRALRKEQAIEANGALLVRCEQAEQRVALLERERKMGGRGE